MRSALQIPHVSRTARVGAALVAVLALPGIALAHAVLRSSLPAAGTTVAAPHELRLTFNEKPELTFTKVALLAGGTDTVAVGGVVADAKSVETVVVPVQGHLAPGSYTVKYRVAGRDGHPMGGSFTFTVGAAK